MFFMGEEVGAQEPYRYNDWLYHREDFQALRATSGAKLFAFYRDVIQLRRQHDALRSTNSEVLHVHDANRVLAFRRWLAHQEFLVCASFSSAPFADGYRISHSALRHSVFVEVLNSDSAAYGGGGVANTGTLISAHGDFNARWRRNRKPAGAIEFDATGRDGRGPANRRGQSAERIEVGRHLAELAIGAGFRDRPDQAVGSRAREHVPGEAGVARERLSRGLHAADARKAQEARQRGRTGEADSHRIINAEIAQAREPAENGLRCESELRYDMHAESGLAGRLDLRREGAVEIERGNARMSVRIAGDSDVLDSAVLQQSALDQLDSGMERAGRLRAIAGDDQDAAHRRLFHQAGEPRGKVLRARKFAHGDVRNGLDPMRPQGRGDGDLLLGGTAGDCADVDADVAAATI